MKINFPLVGLHLGIWQLIPGRLEHSISSSHGRRHSVKSTAHYWLLLILLLIHVQRLQLRGFLDNVLFVILNIHMLIFFGSIWVAHIVPLHIGISHQVLFLYLGIEARDQALLLHIAASS